MYRVVTVTAIIAGGAKYKSGVDDTYEVKFTKQEAHTLVFTDPSEVKWGTTYTAPGYPSSYVKTDHGKITFTKLISSAGSSVLVDPGTGEVSGTENAGEVTVTATTNGGTKYAAGVIVTYK